MTANESVEGQIIVDIRKEYEKTYPSVIFTLANRMEAQRAELAEQVARIERLTAENETLKQAKVSLDSWGIAFVEKLASFVRETIKGGPLTTCIECRIGDEGESTPLVWLWATTSEQEPEARLSEVVAERDRLKASLGVALSGTLRPT